MINYDALKNIDLYNAFAITAYDYSTLKNKQQKNLFILRHFNRYVMMKDDFGIETDCSADIIALKTLSPQRTDYNQIFDSICKSLDLKYETKVIRNYEQHIPGYLNQERIKFYEKSIWMIRIFPWAWPHDLKRACFIQLVHALYIVEKSIRKTKHRLFITFSDMQVIDNIITQIENINGINTCTMQHGLYVDYEEFRTINKANYICSVSQNFLAWGQNTKELIKRYHPNKNVFVCGKPTNTTKNWTEPDKKLMQPNAKKMRCLIVCDQEIFKAENIKIISIAAQLFNANEIHIRTHPQNNRKEYLNLLNTDDQLLELKDYDFVLGHSSTLLYEAIEEGLHVAQLRSAAKKIELPNNMQFLNKSELENICNLPISYYQPLQQKYISCCGEDSLRLTQKAIEAMLT